LVFKGILTLRDRNEKPFGYKEAYNFLTEENCEFTSRWMNKPMEQAYRFPSGINSYAIYVEGGEAEASILVSCDETPKQKDRKINIVLRKHLNRI
jgi:hypothetical protein